MRSTLLALTLGLLGSTAVLAAQQPTPRLTEGPGLKANEDARDKAIVAACHTPPVRANFRGFGGGPRYMPPDKIDAIAGVVGAGRHWKSVWREQGNDADGIVADGNDILVAQQDSSDVVKVTPAGHATVVYRDTDTGGALSSNKQGQLFISERGYLQSIQELAPDHKVLANQINGDSLDCVAGGMNDLSAAANGGVYYTQGDLYYAAPDGKVSRQGTITGTNGIILSPDEKTLYVTGRVPGGMGGTLIAFDVQPDGQLTNQRVFATLPHGGGDGSTVDSEGRIYVTSADGIDVISPDGQVLGSIPPPKGTQPISVAFAGPGKHTLFLVALTPNAGKGHRGLPSDQGPRRQGPPEPGQTAYLSQAGALYSIPMIAQGYADRAK
jgi:sugar lactone lactonase YvrE